MNAKSGWARPERRAEELFSQTSKNMMNDQWSFLSFYIVPKVCLVQSDNERSVTNLHTPDVEALKAMRIIERTPSPSRSGSPEIIDHGSNGSTATHASLARQMAEIEQMRRELAEKMASLQRSSTNSVGGGGQSRSRKRIKREDDDETGGSRGLAKRRRAEKGKGKITVDLTSDSEDERAKSPRVSSDDEGPRSNELMEDEDDDLFVRDN